MAKKELIIMADYSQTTSLTLDELCEIFNLPPEFIKDLLEYEIIRPRTSEQKQKVFDLEQLARIRTALRLQRDLEVNLAGVVIVLNLLDEMAKLQERMEILEKHFLNL